MRCWNTFLQVVFYLPKMKSIRPLKLATAHIRRREADLKNHVSRKSQNHTTQIGKIKMLGLNLGDQCNNPRTLKKNRVDIYYCENNLNEVNLAWVRDQTKRRKMDENVAGNREYVLTSMKEIPTKRWINRWKGVLNNCIQSIRRRVTEMESHEGGLRTVRLWWWIVNNYNNMCRQNIVKIAYCIY